MIIMYMKKTTIFILMVANAMAYLAFLSCKISREREKSLEKDGMIQKK